MKGALHVARTRPGVTLVELVVTLAIIGTLAGVVTLQHGRRRPPTDNETARAEIGSLRARALAEGGVARGVVILQGRAYPVAALPDGSVIADTILRIDRFGGRAR